MPFAEKVIKFIHQMSPKTSEAEYIDRITLAANIARGLIANKEWQGFISKVYLFGSTAKGNSHRLSDIDLAIETQQDSFFGMDFYFLHEQMGNSIAQIREQLNVKSRIKISHQILPTSYLNGTKKDADEKKPKFRENFLNDAILLTSREKPQSNTISVSSEK